MKITIIEDDGVVVVDGVARAVDLSQMDPTIWAVQWDSVRGTGHVEYNEVALAPLQEGGPVRYGRPGNVELTSFANFQWAYDAWVAAAPPVPIPPTLAELKVSAKREIDVAAGAARSRYITSVPGQDAVYLVKAEEAQAYVGAGYTGTVPPHIAAEAQATGASSQAVADLVLATRAGWLSTLSPAIEGNRIGGKLAVDNASDAAGVETALNAALATLGAI